MQKRVCIGETGRRIGESHHRARLSDDEVDRIRDLHEDEVKPLGYRRLAKMFKTKPATIQMICKYRRRACTPR